MTCEENKLKEKLMKIESNDFLIENSENYYGTGLEMLENIGALNPYLRDDLIYNTFDNWISNGRFNAEQLTSYLDTCLSETHIFYKIDENDQDSVYKRTFTLLLIVLILNHNRTSKFLTDKALFEVKDKLIEYMRRERDVRGYDEVKGWAHSTAHSSDVLDELVQCGCFSQDALLEILNAIKDKICINSYVYIDEEGERMVTAVKRLLDRNVLNPSEVVNWIQSFVPETPGDSYIANLHLKVNTKSFLRGLYFRLLDQEASEQLNEEIRKTLKKLNGKRGY